MAIIRLQGEAEKRKGIYYQLDSSAEPIGVGGMGQVFKGICVDERTSATRPVAIKFMYDDLPPHAIERARREASIQLRNDNLVEMLGFIEIKERTALGDVKSHYHVVSELLTGVSLSDLLEGKTKDRNGEEVAYAVKLLQDYKNDSEHFARTIVMNILSGLMALHDAGYIHRDIDPSNIMITDDGHIKLIDFGIAKQMNTLTTNDKGLTVAGKFMGKPEYAAPELALGDIQHQNQTTDIYAMGILLYQCIVGHTPFEGPRHEILEQQLKTKIPVGVIKNKALRGIIATACEKRQDLRYQTSAQMRVALETMNGSGVGLSTRAKTIIASVAAAVLLLVGVSVYLFVITPETKVVTKKVVVHEGPKLTGMAKVADMMKTPATAKEGFEQLKKMADEKNADAVYLMSRLYFVKSSGSEYYPDSIKMIRNVLVQENCIKDDYEKAHQLLLEVVKINEKDYHALFELGRDCIAGNNRNYDYDLTEEMARKANIYFQQALKYATEQKDAEYIERINEEIFKIKDVI